MSNQITFLNQLRYCVAKIGGDSFTIVRVTSMPTAASPKARQGFDYTSLDAATSRFVQQRTGEIRQLMKRTAQDIIELGQKLIAVKDRIGHGYFLSWLEAEFGWSYPTAARFMQVASSFNESYQIDNFAPSALYEIFAPSTSDAAREEALKRAASGEPITHKTAKAIKQKYASPPKKPKPEVPLPEQISQPQSPPTPPLPVPQSGSKLEIVAFRPQAQGLAIPQPARSIAPETGVTLPARRADQTETAPGVPGVWWQLGGRHLLYCGDPNSPEFLTRIIEKVNLLLAFPPISDWQPAIRADVRTIMNEHLPQCQNPDLLDEILESNLLYHSKVGSLVVSCFLPSLEILSVINRLDRRGLIAEPDSRRVNAIISDWKKAGLKVERVS